MPLLAATAVLLSAVVGWGGSASAQDSGPSVLEFDFPSIRIGVAEYDAGPTGATVFYFPSGVMAAADVRGGSPGTVNAHALRLGYEEAFIDAVVFAGGSWYGLSATTGAANAIKELKREEGEYDYIAGVVGGIIYDVGGRRFSRITPDDELGSVALRSARPNRFPMGAYGAGRFAMQGVYYLRGEEIDLYARWPHSGQGGAFAQVGDIKVAVFTVVNAMGAVVGRDGQVVRCHRNDPDVLCPPIADLIAETVAKRTEPFKASDGPTTNTTLTLVVTNQKLSFAALQRLAVQVHTSMGRAIQPFSTAADGDVLYAVTTAEVESQSLSAVDLGVLASELAWDAVLASVPELPVPPAVADGEPDESTLENFAGVYEFPGGGILTLTHEQARLSGQFSGKGRIYFAEERIYHLVPAGDGLFVVDAPARDVLRFNLEDGEVVGLTVNPGRWGLVAERQR
jgi:L-aminopeptidase/D-esterase-like protein